MFKILFLNIFFIIIFNSCGDSGPTGPPPEPETASVASMTVDGLASNFIDNVSAQNTFFSNLASSLQIDVSLIGVKNITSNNRDSFIIDIYIKVSDNPNDITPDEAINLLSSEEFSIQGCTLLNVEVFELITDCLGEPGGYAIYDECGQCDGNGISEGYCDCNNNVLDECNVCGGDDTSCQMIYKLNYTTFYENADCSGNNITYYAGTTYNTTTWEGDCASCNCIQEYEDTWVEDQYFILGEDTYIKIDLDHEIEDSYECNGWEEYCDCYDADTDVYEVEIEEGNYYIDGSFIYATGFSSIEYQYGWHQGVEYDQHNGNIDYEYLSTWNGCYNDYTCYPQYEHCDRMAQINQSDWSLTLTMSSNFYYNIYDDFEYCHIRYYSRVYSLDGIRGCTDPNSNNYNQYATYDDGSCGQGSCSYNSLNNNSNNTTNWMDKSSNPFVD